MADLVGVRLLGGVLLLLANGFFVTTEFAMTRVRQFPESEFTGGGLERAWQMTERLEIYLSGCQLGITIASVGLGVVAEPALASLLDPVFRSLGFPSTGGGHTAIAVILALGVINLAHVIIGEQAPTYLGVERTKLVARYGAAPLYYWTKLMSPFILLADRVAKALLGLLGVEITRSWAEEEADGEGESMPSRGELRRQMGDRLTAAGISDERRQEVINALEIGRTPVHLAMVPREDIIALDTTDSLATNLRRMEEHPHVRFPLVQGGLDSIVGTVYTPALLRERSAIESGTLDLEDVAAPPMTVAADTSIADVIDRFQAESQELALVLNDGEVVGLITATDAFEVITGELEDPLDAER